MGWKLTISGFELREEDVQAGHLVIVGEMAAVDSWVVADPMTSPKMLAAWVAAVIAMNVKDADANTANLMVAKMKVSDLLACYSRDDTPQAPTAATPTDNGNRAAMLRHLAEQAKG